MLIQFLFFRKTLKRRAKVSLPPTKKEGAGDLQRFKRFPRRKVQVLLYITAGRAAKMNVRALLPCLH